MKTILFTLIFNLMIFLPVWGQSQTRGVERIEDQRRLALLIGNSNYQSMGFLSNPINDAEDMAETLRNLGFEVILKTNLNRPQMHEAIRDFGNELKHGGMGLFYFAGHGIQVKGSNYLIPMGVDIQGEDEVIDRAIEADLVLRKMESAGNDLNLVIFDACRNNPFYRTTRSISKGLARMYAPKGTFIMYSTRPGMLALDGKGRNSPFMKHFLQQMRRPGLEVGLMMREVAAGVSEETDNQQTPWIEGLITGRFYFNPESSPALSLKEEEEAWQLVKTTKDLEVIGEFLQRYPSGRYTFHARIKWKELTRPSQEQEGLLTEVRHAIRSHSGQDFNAGRLVKKYTDAYGIKDLQINLQLQPHDEFKLGVIYREGLGTEKNAQEAVYWYEKAAYQGHARAQTRLGFMLRNGIGTPPNLSRALYWYRRAASQGMSQGQFNLGGMYLKGYGVPEDQAQAIRHYQKAAHQGHPMAQRMLSLLETEKSFER
ncbi:MAG: SEL1-like repeat protein [SAR324 cluster bacterium]|nr:SEL1-like repeat protein [SAR324 cluster bacterium]